jgi:hypothetical protein
MFTERRDSVVTFLLHIRKDLEINPVPVILTELKITALWDVTSFNLERCYQRLKGNCHSSVLKMGQQAPSKGAYTTSYPKSF